MKSRSGYVLVNVLILIAILTSIQLMLYRHYAQQKQSLTMLKNEFISQAMIDLQAGADDPVVSFNTGKVIVNDKGLQVQLNNGYKYISRGNLVP
ncbi:MAG: hypothetical protein DUD32_12755 [Lactobacillus sp.]|nr:hypothetical protein [Paucilactobacillus vaccinostercus]RRG07708.1 MAG: hypothetical protein DUD32_12755 [Lactobacillus sp.]